MPNYNEIWSDKGLIFLLKLLVFASNVASKPLKEDLGFGCWFFMPIWSFFCCQFEVVWYNEYYHDRRICLISVQQIYIFSCIQCQYGVCKKNHITIPALREKKNNKCIENWPISRLKYGFGHYRYFKYSNQFCFFIKHSSVSDRFSIFEFYWFTIVVNRVSPEIFEN